MFRVCKILGATAFVAAGCGQSAQHGPPQSVPAPALIASVPAVSEAPEPPAEPKPGPPIKQAIPAVEYLMSKEGGGAKRWVTLGTD
jgi:hypothetical protein